MTQTPESPSQKNRIPAGIQWHACLFDQCEWGPFPDSQSANAHLRTAGRNHRIVGITPYDGVGDLKVPYQTVRDLTRYARWLARKERAEQALVLPNLSGKHEIRLVFDEDTSTPWLPGRGGRDE